MATMSVYLHMGKQGQEKPSQWKVPIRTEESIIGLWSSCLRLQRKGKKFLNIQYLLACLKSTMSKSGTCLPLRQHQRSKIIIYSYSQHSFEKQRGNFFSTETLFLFLANEFDLVK